MLRPRTLALLLALAATAPAEAAAPRSFDVRRAVVVPDRMLVEVDLRCRSSCAGHLHAATFDGLPMTRRRAIRLPGGRTRRVALRLRDDGLARLARSNDERLGDLVLRKGRRRRADGVVFTARMSCATGTTLAASGGTRVFRLRGFGVHVCTGAGGRPAPLADESETITPDSIGPVRVAGPFVAFVSSSAWKCSSSGIVVVDLARRAVVRNESASTRDDSDANGCSGTGPITSMVLRPTGAVAWGEPAADDGIARIRAADAAGVRVLDEGPDVDAASLAALDDGTVVWRRGGTARTAPLG